MFGGACGPQVSTLAMYALLPVVVLMEQKFPPEDIKASHSKFTCDALLKCRCGAKTQYTPLYDCSEWRGLQFEPSNVFNACLVCSGALEQVGGFWQNCTAVQQQSLLCQAPQASFGAHSFCKRARR